MTNLGSTKKEPLANVTYVTSESWSTENMARQVSAAFDILFDEVVRMEKAGEVRCQFLNLVLSPRYFDINGQVGIYFV